MIKYDLKNINDWNFGGSNVTKVYRNGAMVYYKISGESPTPEYQVCFAVVDDISQYTAREFEDVYDKATEKWFKLNNLNQYEEYGIYGSGRTSCEGSTSRVPQGYTEVEYIENTSTSYIDTGAYLNTSNFEIGYTIGNEKQLFGYVHQGCGSCTWLGVEQGATMWWGNFNNNASISSYLTSSENTIIFTQSGATINGNNISKTLSIGSDSIANIPLIIFARYNFNGNTIEHRTDSYMKLKSFYLKNNGTLVRDFVPCKRDSDGKYGLFDIVNNVFYLSPNNIDFSGGEPITPTDCVTTYKGKLTIDDGYEYEWDGSSWVNLGEVSGSTIPDNYVIPFEDSTVKTICVNNWGGGVVAGELTYGEAKQVTSLGSVFKNNTSISSFNELVYFKGLTNLDNGEFAGCRNLTDIVIPNNITTLGYPSSSRNTFSGCTNLSGVTILSGGETLLFDATANNGSYYMNSSHQNVPMIFPDRQITMTTATFGYYDYLAIVYFQSSTPPENLANADINNYRKLANVYCPVGSLSAYQTALSGKGKTIQEYDFETDSLGLLDKEKEWASKTSSQTEYPKYYSEKSEPLDNLTFNTLADAQAYAYNNCVYDGMHATIDGDRYKFDSTDENGWVESGSGLPDVPFTVNYNAKQYNASTKTLLKTEGQLADVDAVITAGTPTVHDGYLTIATSTRATISGYQNYFNRDNNNPNLTIISKQRTDGTNGHMFANRDSNHNWMYRCYSDKLTLHGSSEQGSVAVTTQPVIESVRIDSNRLATYNNYTNNTTSLLASFSYGSTNNQGTALFAGYYSNSGEWFSGDFYWIYMCQGTLTDEQVQQVIDYNENL